MIRRAAPDHMPAKQEAAPAYLPANDWAAQKTRRSERLAHRITSSIQARAERTLIVGAFLSGDRNRVRRRIDTGLAHRPLMTRIAICCLLLGGLPLLGYTKT